MFLGTQWNKSVEAFCLYHTTKLESATHALVKGIKPRTEIVELNKDYFTIFHNSYFYDKDKKIFSKA